MIGYLLPHNLSGLGVECRHVEGAVVVALGEVLLLQHLRERVDNWSQARPLRVHRISPVAEVLLHRDLLLHRVLTGARLLDIDT